MAAFVKFEKYSENLAKGVMNLNGDTLKVYLSNTAPNVATHTVKADIAEIASTGGYVAGGYAVGNATSRTGAVTSVTGTDIPITAAGGVIGAFRYAILYDDTPTSPADPLIGYWDYGAPITLNDTEVITVDFGSAVLTVG